MNTPFRREALLFLVPPALAETPVRRDQVRPSTGPAAGGCDCPPQGPSQALSAWGAPGQTILLTDCGRYTESSENRDRQVSQVWGLPEAVMDKRSSSWETKLKSRSILSL